MYLFIALKKQAYRSDMLAFEFTSLRFFLVALKEYPELTCEEYR